MQPTDLNFVNRNDELKEISSTYYPDYLLLTAPSGYGKSRLLQEVKGRLEKQQWHCLYREITQNTTVQEITKQLLLEAEMELIDVNKLDLTTVQDAGHELGRQLCKILSNRKNLAILLDNFENLDSHSIQQLFDQWVTAIGATFNDNRESPKLRFIWAGRNVVQINSSIPLKIKALTPFDFEAVCQTVEQYDKNNTFNKEIDYIRTFAAYLLYYTGGHPGAMYDILKSEYGFPITTIISRELTYHDTFIKPIIENITSFIPDRLCPIFKKLSVFRAYNACLLQQILDKEIKDDYRGNFIRLDNELQATKLVVRKSGFIRDGIVRRLFLLALRHEKSNQNIFIDLCDKARLMYLEYLMKTTYRPDSVALEGLYQEIQATFYKKEQTANARQEMHRQFFATDGTLQRYLQLLTQKDNAYDLLSNFLSILKERKDWELQFMLNFCMRQDEHYTDVPYDKLLIEVEQFANNMKQPVEAR